MFKFSSEALDLSKIYGGGVGLYKNTFSQVWYLVLLNMLIVGVIQFIAARYLPVVDRAALETLSRTQMLVFSGLNILGFVIAVYFSGIVTYRMYVLGGGAVGEPNAYKAVLHKLLSLSFVKLIILIVVALGMLALVAPGVYLLVCLIFAMPFILFDNKGIWGAIANSFKLTWGNWWRTFFALVPAGVVLVFGMILQHLMLRVTQNTYVAYGIFTVFFTLFMTMIYAFVLVQYNDLKLRRR